jgi:uncharacterized protein (DUF169 family)
MSQVVIENPVLNSPYTEPRRHFKFSDEGITNEIAETRRISSYFVPIAKPKAKGKGKHSCKPGAAILGLINMPGYFSSGEAHLKAGLFFSLAAASKTISEIPKIAPETMRATLVFPLEKAPVEPEVILVEIKPRQALWIALALNYSNGGSLSCSFAGIGCTCGDATVIPYLKHTPNFTIGDFGGSMLRGPEFMIMGLPANRLEEVANNLEKLGCPR